MPAMKETVSEPGQQDHVTVVGAGIMGTGIAYAFASAGCDVLLVDPDEAALQRAQQQVRNLLQAAVQRGLMTPERAGHAASAVEPRRAFDATLSRTRLFIETATENLAIKQQIFRDAEPRLPASALCATNTSALSITEIGSSLQHPERLIGMHFFNPVHKMKLVELVRGLATSGDSVLAARAWVSRIGKSAIVVNDAPGFTTSRMSALMGNEAMYMLAEGVASAEDIDASLRLAFNHPMGPLELGDLTGWDTRLAVLGYLHQVYGEKFRPCPLIIKMVKAGRHGRKTGRGVYAYDAEGNRIPDSGLRVME